MVANPLLARYCTIAIRPRTPTKLAESLSLAKFSVGPKNVRRAITVRKVEQAIMAALKKCTLVFFVTRSEEQKPAAAATRMAASPPQKSIVKKTNESLTVISDLILGIGITSLAPRKTIKRKSIRKRMSSWGASKRWAQNTMIPAPRATTRATKGLT